jgi:hypothetical protein
MPLFRFTAANSGHSLSSPCPEQARGPLSKQHGTWSSFGSWISSNLPTALRRASVVRVHYDPLCVTGSPLNCKVFIVGYNPATSSGQDFWRHWGSTGFDRAAWMQDYLAERSTAPLEPGKTFRPKVSPSRRVIDWILETACVPILETNLYARPSVDMASLTDHDAAPFQFLVSTIGPTLIVTHGKDARQGVAALGLSVPVIEVPHFSRGWSRAAAHDLGRQIRYRAGLDVT